MNKQHMINIVGERPEPISVGHYALVDEDDSGNIYKVFCIAPTIEGLQTWIGKNPLNVYLQQSIKRLSFGIVKCNAHYGLRAHSFMYYQWQDPTGTWLLLLAPKGD